MPIGVPRADELLRSRAVNPYRIATLCGLVLAGLAFAVVFYDASNDRRDLSEEIAGLFLIALVTSPLVLGMAGIAAGGLWRKSKWPYLCGGILSAVVLVYDMLTAWFSVVRFSLCAVRQDWGGAIMWPMVFAINIAIAVILTRAWSRVPHFRVPQQVAFLVSLLLAATCTFLALAFMSSVSFASLLWLTAAVLLLLGTTGEARSLTRRSWPQVLRLLAVGRLSDAHSEPGICPGCGYNLYGLADQRCPECGRAFTFEEIGATPEEMGFRSVSDRRQESLSGTRSGSESLPVTDL